MVSPSFTFYTQMARCYFSPLIPGAGGCYWIRLDGRARRLARRRAATGLYRRRRDGRRADRTPSGEIRYARGWAQSRAVSHRPPGAVRTVIGVVIPGGDAEGLCGQRHAICRISQGGQGIGASAHGDIGKAVSIVIPHGENFGSDLWRGSSGGVQVVDWVHIVTDTGVSGGNDLRF
jgi:hypothetical protein